jgi:hypothetical protein
MAQILTYNELWLIENDIKNLRKQSPALDLFLGERFKRFLQLNSMRLKILHDKMHSLQLKYIEFNVEGEPMHSETEKLPNGAPDWWFKNSYVDTAGKTIIGKDEVKKQYYTEAQEFLSISFATQT